MNLAGSLGPPRDLIWKFRIPALVHPGLVLHRDVNALEGHVLNVLEPGIELLPRPYHVDKPMDVVVLLDVLEVFQYRLSRLLTPLIQRLNRSHGKPQEYCIDNSFVVFEYLIPGNVPVHEVQAVVPVFIDTSGAKGYQGPQSLAQLENEIRCK